MHFGKFSAVLSVVLLSGCVTDKPGGMMDDKSFVRDTNPGTSVMRLSRSAAAAGDNASAVNVLKQGIIANPKAPDLYIELAEKYIKDGKPTEAIKVLESGEKNNPDSYQIIRKLGNAYLMVEQPEKALVVFDKGLEITKDDPLLHSSKGIALDLLSRTEEARKEYETSLKISSENTNALNNLAMSYVLSSDLPKAREILEKIAFNRSAPTQVRENLAFVYAMMGDTDKAKQVGLRDFSESEVKENLEFYKQLSGFMVSDATPAKVPVVASADLGETKLSDNSKKSAETKVEAKAETKPESQKLAEKKEPLKPATLPVVAVNEEPEEKPVAKISESASNEKVVSGEKQKPKLFGFEVEPAKVEEKNSGTVMNAKLDEPVNTATTKQMKEAVDEHRIFPWLVQNKEKKSEQQEKSVEAAEVKHEEVKPQADKVASNTEKKSEPAKQKSADSAPVNNKASEMQLAQTLSSLSPGSGSAASVPASSVPSADKGDSVDRQNIFTSKSSKKYFLQLGEFPTEDAAKKNWDDISEKVSTLRNYQFMFLDSSKGVKKIVIGPFNYGDQYSSIAKELDGKKVTYKVIEQ